MSLVDLQSKYLKIAAVGRLENKVSAFGRSACDIVSKWAIMFAGCLPCSNGEDKLIIGSEKTKTSPEELSGLRKVFDAFDANEDGFLTLEELCSWMKKLGLPITKVGLSKMLQSCDWDNDGRLDFNEFVALTQTLHNHANSSSGEASSNGQSHLATCNGDEGEDDPKSEMKEAFEVFDKDGNGLISPTELRATLCDLGLLSSPDCLSRIHSMIKKVDVDGDGQVSFCEFETMMNGK